MAGGADVEIPGCQHPPHRPPPQGKCAAECPNTDECSTVNFALVWVKRSHPRVNFAHLASSTVKPPPSPAAHSRCSSQSIFSGSCHREYPPPAFSSNPGSRPIDGTAPSRSIPIDGTAAPPWSRPIDGSPPPRPRSRLIPIPMPIPIGQGDPPVGARALPQGGPPGGYIPPPPPRFAAAASCPIGAGPRPTSAPQSQSARRQSSTSARPTQSERDGGRPAPATKLNSDVALGHSQSLSVTLGHSQSLSVTLGHSSREGKPTALQPRAARALRRPRARTRTFPFFGQRFPSAKEAHRAAEAEELQGPLAPTACNTPRVSTSDTLVTYRGAEAEELRGPRGPGGVGGAVGSGGLCGGGEVSGDGRGPRVTFGHLREALREALRHDTGGHAALRSGRDIPAGFPVIGPHTGIYPLASL
eukprot:730449-Prorocentrum_minimum.AAC.1